MNLKYTILLVDDKEVNLESLKAILNDNFMNLEIYEALSAQVGLDIIAQNKIDIILSDVQMPEIDGYKFAKILSSNIRTKYIPIVFISAAFTTENFVLKGLNLGAIDYISKPINVQSFTNRIKIYLNMLEKQKSLEKALATEKELREENIRITEELRIANEEREAQRRELETKIKKELREENFVIKTELEFVSKSLEDEINMNYDIKEQTIVNKDATLVEQKIKLDTIKEKLSHQKKMIEKQLKYLNHEK